MILRSYQTPHQVRVVPLRPVNGSAPPVRRVRDYIDVRAKPMAPTAIRIVPSILDIQQATASFYGIPEYEMASQRRSLVVAHPRGIAMCLARALTNASLPVIGRHFGGRDHSTVILAIRRVEGRLAADPEISRALRSICASVARATELRDWEFRGRELR